MRHKKLGDAEWGDYLTVCETKEKLITQLNEVKRLLKTCGYKEELETIKLLKELCGVR